MFGKMRKVYAFSLSDLSNALSHIPKSDLSIIFHHIQKSNKIIEIIFQNKNREGNCFT